MNYLNIEGLDMLWERIKAGILGVRELARKNEQRLDSVEGTTNEANQRSKDNTSRLDSVEGIANATKALTDIHETRLGKVEGVAGEANTRSQNNTKRLDKVEGVANGAQALANNHTELLNKANTAIADLIEQDKSHSEFIEELTGTCEALQDDIDRVDGKVNTVQTNVNTKADKNHTHTSIGYSDSTSVETDGNNVIVRDSNGIQVFKTLNKFGKDNVDYPDEIGVEFRTADATEAENKGSHSLGIISNKRIKLGNNGDVERIQIGIDGNKGFTSNSDHTTIKNDNINYLDIDANRAKLNHESKVTIGIDSADVVKVDNTETVLKNVQTQSIGLRLKADQSELKFSGKGITVTETETKVTSAGKVELLAPSIEARDNEDNPIFSTGRYTESGSTTNEKQTIIFVGNKDYQAEDGTSADIVLNGDIEVYTTLQSLQSGKRSRFEMPLDINLVLEKGKLLNEKLCDYLHNAIHQYYGNYDYETDGNSEMLRLLSGENIYPVILSKYYHVGEGTAHAQHFKPWQVEFYDEIQSYNSPDGVLSIPVIRIHIGEDFAEWLLRFNYKGLSEKVSYMQFKIGADEMGEMPFSLYNESGNKIQEFTLI